MRSSNIKSVSWENGTLVVTFHSGHVYEYNNVPRREYIRLMAAPSAGEYFSANIRMNYKYRRIE